MYVINRGENWRQIYRAIKLGWPLRQRDLVYTEHTRVEESGEILICSRSSKELDETMNELSLKAGRTRAEMRLAGYRLKREGTGKTEIVCVLDIDLEGIFAIGYLYRGMAASYLKGVWVGGGDEDRKNIEMGRMIKRVAGETDDHKNAVVL
ncbi:hypothetical protein TrLO_g3060 [Triparma laevis f. longispina]|uniref:START domain-containing protein n=1 Tax=Triparma laevis f. longispina TaxID=1714387 RepID=A0A9W7CGR7_9STRA|nr:hypothetical protein TrLO_g3060 [Triparma laevis f. longispina]